MSTPEWESLKAAARAALEDRPRRVKTYWRSGGMAAWRICRDSAGSWRPGGLIVNTG